MVGEAVEKKLYNAASKGDLSTLQQLLEEDSYLVHAHSFACSRNLLHVATMHGQKAIVEEVLRINPRLARIPDSQKLSPLHIAAAEGHVEIAKKLVSIAPEMCLWRDDQGMNPVHTAAMNGHVEVLKLLLEEGPLPAMEKVYRGETVLHLCVKHGQLGALKVLVDKLEELVDATDDDGETILHMAVRSTQLETVRYLVESNKLNQQRAPNSLGRTPLLILHESPPGTTNYSEIRKLLLTFSRSPMLKIVPKLADITMVVLVLIATMAFQVAVSPPGGVWQDDTSSHKAGDAVMASTHPNIYTLFLLANTVAFVASLVTILLITTGLPSEYTFFLRVSTYAMWVSVAAIVVSYGASTMAIAPNTESKSTLRVVVSVFTVAFGIHGIAVVFSVTGQEYVMWWYLKRQQEYVTTESLLKRALYWIFQQLETRGYFRIDTSYIKSLYT